MAGETVGGGAPAAPAPAHAPAAAPVRQKVSNMTQMLRDGGPPSAAGVANIMHQQVTEPAPLARVQNDPEGIPDMGHPGDLDGFGDEQRVTQGEDGFGQSMELDDSIPSELVSPDEYAALKAKFDADDLSPDFDEKWVEVPVPNPDGSTFQKKVPVREMKAGYLRNSDYSRRLGELSQREKRCEMLENNMRAFVTDLSNPQSFLPAIQRLGVFGAFEKGAEVYAVDRYNLMQMERQNPQAYRAEMELRAERAARAQERAAFQQTQAQLAQVQQQVQPQPSEQTQQVSHQLSQMLPIAQKKVGLAYSPFAEQIFTSHWQNMLPALKGPLTTDFVVSVMQATKETVEQYVAQNGVIPQPQQQGLPPAQRGGAPANMPANANGQNGKSMKISDMHRVLRDGAR